MTVQSGAQREAAINRCSRCESSYRTLADDVNSHDCPRCGYGTTYEAETRETIRSYVTAALDRGSEPTASDFVAAYNTLSTRWDFYAVEAEIERIINEREALV